MKNILVAEDDITIRSLIGEVIRRRGSTPLLAEDGEEALQIFSKEKVDLMITDLKMPRMDGMTLIRRVREKNDNLPIIIITGYGSDKNRGLASDYNVFAFLSKPCSIAEISDAISGALNNLG